MSDYAAARHNMIENQIRVNRVTDPRILDAFEAIPRERFVQKLLQGVAYTDEDLHLGGGRYLIEPMILARLLQAADLDATDTALDIGCCTGYSTAVLSRLVASVIAVEDSGEFVEAGNQRLSELEIDNAAVIQGALRQGNARQQPYDLILIAGGVQDVPETLMSQLKDDGRLVTVLYDGSSAVGRAAVIQRVNGVNARRIVFDASTPMLPGFSQEPEFVF